MESKSNNFISYVGFEENEIQPLSLSRRNSLIESNIKLLPGEVLIAEAQNVLMFLPVSDQKQGISGLLSVTNFKLTFITTNDSNEEEITHQQNHLYGYTDTCLSNIDEIHVILGDKKRRLFPGNAVPSKVKGIFIICKNMRTWSFSFKFSPVGHGKTLLAALLHHAFPSRHQLLFAYDYKKAYYSSMNNGVRFFRDMSDWENEFVRTLKDTTTRNGWRLSRANNKFQLSSSLSQYIIIPASITDNQLVDAVKYFQGNRPPVWCWTTQDGAALVKMSELSSTINERVQENIMFENIRKSHPHKVPPVVIELNKGISIKSITGGFAKFLSLCSPENIRQFWEQDNSFYSSLETTKWMKYISYCLEKAVEACEHLSLGFSVILQEGAGRDICCIISSLVQILLDPYFRTISGFQCLLQKEWVAAGHPFCDRLGHIVHANTEKSPLLLLYLDCVWQLWQQFPTRFEFTETYLTTLWDAAHVSIFDTFIFNCERDRALAITDPNNPLILRSVWEWREQFSDEDILLFYNPLFSSHGTDTAEMSIMKPVYCVPNLEIWAQCYFRWIPPLEIHNGGQSNVEHYARLLQDDINKLKVCINKCFELPVDKLSTYLVHKNIDSFYPFSNKRSNNYVNTTAMNTSVCSRESLLDTHSLVTTPE